MRNVNSELGMILILGVTASGKGRLAFDLADSMGAEIISIDSMKVYRRMNIGTGKPPEEARRRIKYHLIDIVEPSESFSVGAFLDAALHAIEQIRSRNKPVVAVGGTALYIKALLYGLFEGPPSDEQIRTRLKAEAQAEGLNELHRRLKKIDPDAAERIHPNDAKRIIRALEVHQITGRPISSLQQQWPQGRGRTSEVENREPSIENRVSKHNWTIIGLRREKAEENKRINARAKRMIDAGLVDEVKALLAEDRPLSKQARCAIGYAEIIEHLFGRMSLEEAVELIKKNTRRLAKSQRTWFKTFKNVNWLDVEAEEPTEEILDRAKTLLKDAR
jgi:tRNA dimethylallyltransferase